MKDVLIRIAPFIIEENFHLAGGTGLALQIGHRVSEDPDFFRNLPFNEQILLTSLKNKVSSFEEILSEKFSISISLDEVRCSFFYYELPLIFEPDEFQGIQIAKWQDILAEKFKTVSQRGSKKDFYDIFATIKLKNLSIEEAMIQELEHPLSGPAGLKAAGFPIRFSGLPADYPHPAPYLGQNNEEIYMGLLGFSAEEFAQLQRGRVI